MSGRAAVAQADAWARSCSARNPQWPSWSRSKSVGPVAVEAGVQAADEVDVELTLLELMPQRRAGSSDEPQLPCVIESPSGMIRSVRAGSAVGWPTAACADTTHPTTNASTMSDARALAPRRPVFSPFPPCRMTCVL